ncbi:MAG: hypothetical protein J0H89_12450, partial [Rhizobiales bacterium]|nr:hypothetical protein [Hyphomicrobiales bacterium]
MVLGLGRADGKGTVAVLLAPFLESGLEAGFEADFEPDLAGDFASDLVLDLPFTLALDVDWDVLSLVLPLVCEEPRLWGFSFAARTITWSRASSMAGGVACAVRFTAPGAAIAGVTNPSKPTKARRCNRQAFVPGANGGSLRAIRI